MCDDFCIPCSSPFRTNEVNEGDVLQTGLGFFNPTMLFAERQPVLSRLLSRQIGQEVAQQRLPGFVAAQIVLRTFDHEG